MPTFTELPPELQNTYDALERRRKLREAMMNRPMMTGQTTHIPGRYGRTVPTTGLAGAADVSGALTGMIGRIMEEKKRKKLAEQAEQGRSESVRNVMEAWKGRPQAQAVYNEGQMGTGPVVPGIKPDPQGAVIEALSSPYLRNTNLGQGLMNMMPTAPKPMTVGAGAAVYQPGEGEVYRNPKLTPDVSVSQTVGGEDPLRKKWLDVGKEQYQELGKEAKQAVSSKKAMERFAEKSDIAGAGGFQPVMTMLKNFGASFGWDSESLNAEQLMAQAQNEALVGYMKSMGARGLTDQDMKRLETYLPRINTSKEARVEVSNILIGAYDNVIGEFSELHDFWSSKESLSDIMPKSQWLTDWEKQRNKGKGASTEGWTLMEDANGNKALVGPNGEIKEVQ